jgi:hypothetical protein
MLRQALGGDDARTQDALARLVEVYEVWGKRQRATEYRALVRDSATATRLVRTR